MEIYKIECFKDWLDDFKMRNKAYVKMREQKQVNKSISEKYKYK
jgi:hypothetical protein